MARCLRSSVVVIAGAALMLAFVADAQLVQNFYKKSCPIAETIVIEIVQYHVRLDRTKAAALLRLQFHDCFVDGCDASVLLTSTPGHLAERDALPNARSLRGFDVIDHVKTELENACPGVVSCADVLALAARDAVAYIGGPTWTVSTGRRDGRISEGSHANTSLPSPLMSFAQLQKNFANVGLNSKDLVVLSGAHTIGLAHCSNVIGRVFNFPGTKDGIDPSLNKTYAAQLRKLCPQGSAAKLIPMDPTLGGQTFDSNYYSNVLSKKGLFPSDQSLLRSTAAHSLVIAEAAAKGSNFFADFGASMQKMGRIDVITSPLAGEIRHKCSVVNPPKKVKKSVKTVKGPTKRVRKPLQAKKHSSIS